MKQMAYLKSTAGAAVESSATFIKTPTYEDHITVEAAKPASSPRVACDTGTPTDNTEVEH